MGAYGKKLGRIANPQVSLKLDEAVVISSTNYRIKYFDQALSRLTSSGQVDIQISRAPTGESSENRDPSDFAQTR